MIHPVPPFSTRRLHSMVFLVRAPAPGARTLRRASVALGEPQARRIAESAPRRSAASHGAVSASYVSPIIRSSAPSVVYAASRLASGRRPPATPRLLSGGTRSATSAAGGVARAALAAAPRLDGLAAARPRGPAPRVDGPSQVHGMNRSRWYP